jgi:hypothetical protein
MIEKTNSQNVSGQYVLNDIPQETESFDPNYNSPQTANNNFQVNDSLRTGSANSEHYLNSLGSLSYDVTGPPVYGEDQNFGADGTFVENQQTPAGTTETPVGNNSQVNPEVDSQFSNPDGQVSYSAEDADMALQSTLQNNPDALENFEKLSDEEKDDLMDVANSLGQQAEGVGENTGAADPRLVGLLQSGKLTEEKDAKGNTLLDNLSDMSQQEYAPGLNGEQIMDQTVEHLSNPDVINQGNRNTCSATTLQYIQATEKPADYVNMVSDLTSPEGVADMPHGEGQAVRASGVTSSDDSGRDDVSRIYQSTMTDHGINGQVYDNANDMSVNPQNPNESTTGIAAEDFNSLASDVLPEGLELKTKEGAGSVENIEGDINRSLDNDCPVPVGMQWGTLSDGSPAEHKLLLTGMDEDSVYLRNPYGHQEGGSQAGDNTIYRELADVNGDGMTDPGHIRMPKDVFHENLVDYHVPENTDNPESMSKIAQGLSKLFTA